MIPKRLLYAWFGPHPMPSWAHQNMVKARTLMPDWEVILITDHPLLHQEPWIRAEHVGIWSDGMRYYELMVNGGVWSDLDIEPIKPWDGLIQGDIDFVLGQNAQIQPIGIQNAWLACKPGSRWMTELYRRFSTPPHRREDLRELLLEASPRLEEPTKEVVEFGDVRVLPSEYFFVDNPSTAIYGRHKAAGTWWRYPSEWEGLYNGR